MKTIAQPNSFEFGRHATWLRPDWPALVDAFETLGEVELETANPTATHIKRGRFEDISFQGPIGLVLGADIDLRLFSHHWKWAVAARETITIYDRYGRKMLELRLLEGSDKQAFSRLVDEFGADQAPDLEVEASPQEAAMTVEDVEPETREAFAKGWRELQDTHDFFGLLRKHELDRHVAVQIAPEGLSEKLAPSAHEAIFEAAEESQTPIMIFVSSGGCVQIHTGLVETRASSGSRYSLQGPNFEMNIDLAHLGEAWVVRKPTVDGIVTAVEFFDVDRNLAFQVFGERKPGKAELSVWREIVAGAPVSDAPVSE